MRRSSGLKSVVDGAITCQAGTIPNEKCRGIRGGANKNDVDFWRLSFQADQVRRIP